MSTTGASTPSTRDERTEQRSNGRAHTARRLVTETKAAFKTTEFYAFLAVLAGVLIAAAVVDQKAAPATGRQARPGST